MVALSRERSKPKDGLAPDGTAKRWTEQYRVVPEQAAEWSALRADHPRAPLCVAGDFNMSLGGPHYYGTKRGRELLELGLDAAGLACVTRTEQVPPGLLHHANIDHVAVPAAWASRSRVVAAWPGTVDGGAPQRSRGREQAAEWPRLLRGGRPAWTPGSVSGTGAGVAI